jgi:hypothetical protein
MHNFVKQKLLELDFVTKCSARNRTLACGKKVYFKVHFISLTYADAYSSLEYIKIMNVIQLFYPNASVTSGGFGLRECNVTVAAY